jgi:hypothetical protein
MLSYLQNSTVTFTVFALSLMTIEKFLGIIWPLKKRLSILQCKRLVFVSLIFSLIVSSPIAAFTKFNEKKEVSYSFETIKQILNINETLKEKHINSFFVVKEQCQEIWPKNSEFIHSIYNFFLFCIQYILPLLTVIIVHAVIAFKFKSKSRFDSQISRKKQKKKVFLHFYFEPWTPSHPFDKIFFSKIYFIQYDNQVNNFLYQTIGRLMVNIIKLLQNNLNLKFKDIKHMLCDDMCLYHSMDTIAFIERIFIHNKYISASNKKFFIYLFYVSYIDSFA